MSKQITFQDAICFAASSFYYLVEKMQMDLHEPPMSQVAYLCAPPFFCFFFLNQLCFQTLSWLDEGKLNQLHRLLA